MALTSPVTATIWEDSGAQLMGRFTGNAAANIKQSDISSISYAVFDKQSATPTTATASGSLTVANVVFDTLQTDARWTVDTTGYNFRYDAPATHFPDGGHTYRVEVIFTPTAGEPFPGIWEVTTAEVFTS